MGLCRYLSCSSHCRGCCRTCSPLGLGAQQDPSPRLGIVVVRERCSRDRTNHHRSICDRTSLIRSPVVVALLHEVGVGRFVTALPSSGQRCVGIGPWRLLLASPAAPVASATPALYTLFQALERVDSASLPLHWPSRCDGGGEPRGACSSGGDGQRVRACRWRYQFSSYDRWHVPRVLTISSK